MAKLNLLVHSFLTPRALIFSCMSALHVRFASNSSHLNGEMRITNIRGDRTKQRRGRLKKKKAGGVFQLPDC